MGGAEKIGHKISPFHNLNAKLKPLYRLQVSMHNVCFRRLHTQPVSHPLEKLQLFLKCRQIHSDSLSELQSFMPPDLEKHQETLMFSAFLCHSRKPPTVHVPPGLHKAV